MKMKKLTLFLPLIILLVGKEGFGDDPDIRNIPPDIMLLVDSSGSMDYLRVTHATPQCKNNPDFDDLSKETRWMMILDALLGPIDEDSFSCEVIYPGDTVEYYESGIDKMIRMSIPRDSMKPHFIAKGQRDVTYGILERYRSFVRFGLATLDSFESADTGENGMWSYGPVINGRNAGIKREEPINGGVQQDIIPGALVSWGDDTTNQDSVNAKIRRELIQTIPYCASPLASALDDIEYFLKTGVNTIDNDRYFNCRERAVVLITDVAEPKMPHLSEEQWFGSTPSLEASDLWVLNPKTPLYVLWIPGCPRGVEQFQRDLSYVNDIANAGCPPSDPICPDGAYVVESRDEIMQYLDEILKKTMLHAISRTIPVTTNQVGPKGEERNIVQFQFNTYFAIPPDGGPWQGFLERYNYVCNSADEVVLDDTTYLDYGAKLDQKANRTIFTSINYLTRQSGEELGTNDIFDSTHLTPEILGDPTKNMAWVDSVVNFVYGRGGTARDPATGGHKLADMFHASAVILPPPVNDLPFLSYQKYQIDNYNRIPVLFVATNEGILHAFRVQDTGDANQQGEELWAYIPGMFLDKIARQIPDKHLWGLDTTPVVGDIRTFKGPTYDPNREKWKAILVGGMRQGGFGYYALDVTDPLKPRFLWEITPDKPGFLDPTQRPFAGLKETYARPLLGTVFTQHPDPEIGIKGEIGVVIFPGGFNPATRNSSTSLYVVTAEKGILIKELKPEFPAVLGCSDPPDCNSKPECCAQLVTSPVGFSSMPGYLTTRVFVGDDRGRIWRADLTSWNPDKWKLTLFYPVKQGVDSAPYTTGEPVESPPAIAVDEKGRLVLVFGTGGLDDLTAMTQNYIFSVTEEIQYDSMIGGYVGKPVFNWMIELQEGEKLTGQPNVFNQIAYFSTFVPYTNEADLCQVGEARIWGVNYNEKPNPDNNDGFAKLDVDEVPDGEGTLVMYTNDGLQNVLITGITVVQRPSCLGIDPLTGLPLNTSAQESYEIVAQKSGMGVRPGQPETQTVRIKIPPPRIRNVAQAWGLLIE